MKAPLSWLKDYVDIDIPVSELEKKLFDGGLEVEELIYLGKEISRCVVGVITTMEKHADSDHLQICKLDCGDEYGRDIQIVTGADNVFVGAHVPVALDNSTLAGGVKIKKGKLRGVESNGMLCSGEELGITDDMYPGADVYGILILPEDTVAGTDIKEVVGLDDYIFDIGVTANRPDCQSIIGIAREIAAILGKKVKEPALDFTPVKEANDEAIKVSVEAGDICPRYIAHFVKDVKIEKSPQWMRKRLFLNGINSISNIVDITNFILLELGQPMHAFDLTTLEDKTIVVRRAKDKEKITTLDEKEFELTQNNLVICDSQKPVALAGIMGGLNSEIKDNTQNVLFESAKFARDSVRKTSRALGQTSDSSLKFGKGVDEYTTEMAMKRALHLIEELGCGTVSQTHFDISSGDKSIRTIKTTFAKINGVLGIEVPKETIVDILTRLEFNLDVNGEEISATAPLYREDVYSYEDLAEEVIRLYGYDHIPASKLDTAEVTDGGLNLAQKLEYKMKNALAKQGMFETINFSFYSTKDLDMLHYADDAEERKAIRILNPITENYSIMCTTLAPVMVNTIVRNYRNGNKSGRFFELAHIFKSEEAALTKLPEEIMTLSLGAYGDDETFFTVKGIIEGMAEEFGLKFEFAKGEKSFLHPGMTADIFVNGECIGYMGRLSHQVEEELVLGKPAYVAEINYDMLKQHFGVSMKYVPISQFDEVERDFALICDEAVTCGEIESTMKKACKYITEVKLFDVFRSEKLGEGKKSMAFNVIFTPEDKELSQKEMDKFTSKILKDLEFKLGIQLR